MIDAVVIIPVGSNLFNESALPLGGVAANFATGDAAMGGQGAGFVTDATID